MALQNHKAPNNTKEISLLKEKLNQNNQAIENILINQKLNLKNDVIFKAFFAKRGNEQFLIDFLSGLLKDDIQEIEIKEEVDLLKLANEQRGGRLDLQAKLKDGTIVNIEMQMRRTQGFENRTAFYSSKVLSNETEKGTQYEDIKQVIMINILNYSFLDFEEYVSETVTVLKEHREYEVVNLVKYYFIELPKFRKQNPDMNDKLNQWLAIIDSEDRGRIKMAEEKNEKIKGAISQIGVLTGDAEIRRMAELREKWEMDRNSELGAARKEEKRETAKKMILKNIPIETIIEITELKKEEIEKIKADL